MTNLKQIIQRKLPLDVKYICTDKKYIPLLDGYGCGCDNCGKLISNIATVKSVNGTYNIGFDCLETFLLNNNLLEGFDISEYELTKKRLGQVLRFGKKLRESIDEHNAKYIYKVVGVEFERSRFTSFVDDYYTYYYVFDNGKKYNTYVKIKGMEHDFLVNAIKNIFPKLEISSN